MNVTINFDGHSIRILDGPYINENSPSTAAHEFAKHLISQLSQMKKYAAEHLMDAYDSIWPEDEHQPLSKLEFEANLTSPKIIILDHIGSAAVYFDDAGMFRDDFSLSIAIRNGKITDVSLE